MTATTPSVTAAAHAGIVSAPADPTELILHALDAAAQAHHLYEVELGGPHADWSPWYAQYMARTLTDAGYRITKPSGH